MAKVEWNERLIVENIKDKILDRLELVGVKVEGDAKRLCPVDLGNLRDSINHEVKTIALNAVVRIGTPVEYGPYVEFGTGEKAENGQGRKGGWFFTTNRPVLAGWLKPLYQNEKGEYVYFTYGSHPQPFLRPALYNNKQEIIKILTT